MVADTHWIKWKDDSTRERFAVNGWGIHNLALSKCGGMRGYVVFLLSYCGVVFSLPMPPRVTDVELMMGAGLLVASLMLTPRIIFYVRQDTGKQLVMGLTGLLFFVPMFIGYKNGFLLSEMMRDIVPLAFLLGAPIILTYSLTPNHVVALKRGLLGVLIFVGVVTGISFLIGMFKFAGTAENMYHLIQGGFGQKTAIQGSVDVFLKLYDPAVLFVSIFISCWGVVFIASDSQKFLLGLGLLVLGGLIAYGFMVLGLRAYSAFFLMIVTYVTLAQLRKRMFVTRLLPLLLITFWFLFPKIQAVIEMMLLKQQLLGSNGKLEEWQAVIATMSASSQTLWFGIGWGGTFDNPILNAPTRFTHSMISFFILKTGITGTMVLCSVFLLMLFGWKNTIQKILVSPHEQIILLAGIPPIIIGVLFEPTYKMLSYGILLALLQLHMIEKRE